MKYEEFKREAENLGFDAVKQEYCFALIFNDQLCAVIAKDGYLEMDTKYDAFHFLNDDTKKKIFRLCTRLAETDIDERDEIRYIIPLPQLKTTDGKQQFLTHQNDTFFASRRDKSLRQTWKKQHLCHVPEVYRKYAVELDE